MSFTRKFLLGPLYFRTALPCSGGYHLERGGMSLHDAVGVHCKNGATTKKQGAGVKFMGKGLYVGWLCVLSDLTWQPLLGGVRKSLFLFNRIKMKYSTSIMWQSTSNVDRTFHWVSFTSSITFIFYCSYLYQDAQI